MSGTNQSKLVKKEQEMDLKSTNSLDSCIPNKEEDGTLENSNSNIKRVPDDLEGNLQLQIQEAIAATIRASRQSGNTEQQVMEGSDSRTESTSSKSCENSTGLPNTETYESCKSDRSTPSTNIEEVEDTGTQDLNEGSDRDVLENAKDADRIILEKTVQNEEESGGNITNEEENEDSNGGVDTVEESQDSVQTEDNGNGADPAMVDNDQVNSTNSVDSQDCVQDPPPIENDAKSKELVPEEDEKSREDNSGSENVQEVPSGTEKSQKDADISVRKFLISNEILPDTNHIKEEKIRKAANTLEKQSEETDTKKDFPNNEEDSHRVFVKVMVEPDLPDLESNQEDFDKAMSEMQDEDVFPVIEIVEEEPEDVEIVKVDESQVIKPKKGKKIFKNRNISGTIEILSDEEDVVVTDPANKIQKKIETDTVENQKKIQLEDILQQVKMLTSTEYLLFYLKLPPKWDHEKTTLNPTDTIKKKLEKNEITIPESSNNILKSIDASIKQTSKNTVDFIVNRVKDLTVKEYLWLRCYLPSHCINPSLQHCLLPSGSVTTSQTVLWLKSHLEEFPESLMLKQDVFNKYEDFCKQNNVQLMSSSRFGKLINQVFPNIGRKRLRAKGSSAYYYVGLQRRCKLDPPRLPKLKQISVPGVNDGIKCKIQTNVAYFPPAPTEQPTVVENGIKPRRKRKQVITVNESDDIYRSNQLDGQTILIHDPLALLDISTNDSKLPNDTSFHQSSHSVKTTKYTRTSSQLHNHFGITYPSPKTQNFSKIEKVKYKEYKHPSVQKVFKEFNKIELPVEVFRRNINPSVTLNNKAMHNWYAERLEKYKRKALSLVIQKSNGKNFNVTCTGCKDEFEIDDTYARALNDLKAKLSNVFIKPENSSNYKVIQRSFNVASENQTFRIVKQLTNRNKPVKINPDQNRHVSVERLFKRFKNIDVPEEILKTDIDPFIVLNSGEVIEWYIKQLNFFKKETGENGETVKTPPPDWDATSSQQSISSFRHSKAKMMNFCEIDSSDDEDDNIPVSEYKFIAFGNKNKIENVEETVEATVPVITQEIVINETPREENLEPCVGQKRLNEEEETNETELKRKKFYCSKITISPKQQQSPENSPLSPITDKKETFVCPFCLLAFDQKYEFMTHKRNHLSCLSCKRRLKNSNAMIQHLIKHCSLNRIKNKPLLRLRRIDSIPSMRQKYAEAFKQPVQNYDVDFPTNFVVNKTKFNVKRTYSKLPRCTTLRILKRVKKPNLQALGVSEATPGDAEQIFNPVTQQYEPNLKLKNTISSNLNKILLLSNNSPAATSPNIVYGTLYVNNRSSPSICLNSSEFNPIPSSSGVNYVMNTNPSCSNDLQQPPTFMQIVESPNTTQYANPSHAGYEQHQDHSYHQQQLFQIGSNIFVSNNVPQLTELQSGTINTTSTNFPTFFPAEQNKTNETETESYVVNNTETSSVNNNPPQGQFKIRVKSIQELR